MKISVNQINFLFPCCIVLLWMFCACKTPNPSWNIRGTNESKQGHTSKELSKEELLQNSALFLDGLKEKYLNNFDKALGLFAQCIKQNPNNDAAMYEMASLLFNDGKYDDALVLIKNAAKKKPDNVWYSLLVAQTFIALRDYDNADKTYKKLTDKFPDKQELYLDWADLLIVKGNYNEAIKIYDITENKFGRQAETTLQKEKLYMQLGKKSKAFSEIESLVEAFPEEIQYQGLLAELYMSNNMPLKALSIYEAIKKTNPEDPYVHLSLADYYRIQNLHEQSIGELKTAFSSKDLDIDSKVKILLSIMNLEIDPNDPYQQALPSLAQIVVDSSPEEPKAYSVLGDILFRGKNLSGARDAFRKVVEYDNNKYVVWQQLFIIEFLLEDYTALASESKKAMELFPEQAETYLYNGLAEMRQGNFSSAINSLTTGKNFIADDDKQLIKYYTIISECYYKNKNFDLSFESFEKALSIEPNNAYLLNNYSFYLALQNTNLMRAEQLSKRLISLYPENASYQDTYAWVLFRLKKYEEAKAWIEKALAGSNSESATILDHYGDILYKNNLPEQAVEYWEKAKKAGLQTTVIDKKINDKTYYE
ncbi:MAG: tetratricopeptide repeat protein [Bacteroidales bacterium]|nr:tetratricopeptide repeat protein [Bacteroidales bacterium]MDD4214013.1 tetratricopeptide repeat protein [Bacteroidales bacterium]